MYYKTDIYVRTVQILANICVLAGVAVGMYHAAQNPEAMLSAFSRWFFPILAVVLICSWGALRMGRRFLPQAGNVSMVHLPKIGPRMVRWTVLAQGSRHARRA